MRNLRTNRFRRHPQLRWIDVAAILAQERDEEQPEHIVRGDARGQEPDAVHPRVSVLEDALDDLILAEETAEAGNAADREHADEDCPEGERRSRAQAAHLAHVLLVVQRVDDQARCEEELRLEERMREEVRDAARVRADADAHDHVADLRHRRVRENALDVPLCRAQDRADDRRQRADRADEHLRARAVTPQRRAARNEIDAGRDHRCGVDERGDRRRALHRVGKPCVQRDLRRLRCRADEEPGADRVEQRRAECRRRRECVGEADRVDVRDDEEDREHDADVADDVQNERLARGGDRAAAFEPEADEKVRSQADEAPADQQPDPVVREHEQHHREDEEIHVREEAREGAIAVHVSDRVEMDEKADAGDDKRPEQRERIEREPEVEAAHPREEREMHASGLRRRAPEEQRRDERDPDRGRREPAGEIAQPRSKRPARDRAGERNQEREQQHHPRSALASSTSTFFDARNAMTTIASAIAASAAATVITRNAKMCPASFSQARA